MRRVVQIVALGLQVLLLAMPGRALAQAAPQPAQAAPEAVMTADELHRRIVIMGYYVTQASAAMAAGDQATAAAQFDRFQKAYDEVDDEVILPLYPTQYHLLDEVNEGLETVFLFNRSQGASEIEPLLGAAREQLLDIAHDLEDRMQTDGPETVLPLYATP